MKYTHTRTHVAHWRVYYLLYNNIYRYIWIIYICVYVCVLYMSGDACDYTGGGHAVWKTGCARWPREQIINRAAIRRRSPDHTEKRDIPVRSSCVSSYTRQRALRPPPPSSWYLCVRLWLCVADLPGDRRKTPRKSPPFPLTTMLLYYYYRTLCVQTTELWRPFASWRIMPSTYK